MIAKEVGVSVRWVQKLAKKYRGIKVEGRYSIRLPWAGPRMACLDGGSTCGAVRGLL